MGGGKGRAESAARHAAVPQRNVIGQGEQQPILLDHPIGVAGAAGFDAGDGSGIAGGGASAVVAASAQIADSAAVLGHDDDAGSGGDSSVGGGLAYDAGGLVPQVSPPLVAFFVLVEFGAGGDDFDVDEGEVSGGPGFGDVAQFAGARAGDRDVFHGFRIAVVFGVVSGAG